jgi:hypothetical protein
MFLSQIFVWFWSRLAGLGQIFSMNVGVLRHHPLHIAQPLGDLLAKQQRRQQRLQGGVLIGTVDPNQFGQVGAVAGALGGQSLQVIKQHFGSDILKDRLLRQVRDVFQIEAMLEPLERFFDTPALVIELAERASRETHNIEQVGHQHAHLTIGRNVAHQSHGLRFARVIKNEISLYPIA